MLSMLSATPVESAQQIGAIWEALRARADALTSAPRAALQDFYNTYAKVAVAISANRPAADINATGNWNAFSQQLDVLEKQYPPGMPWGWIAGAAALGGLWWMRRRAR